jgi:PIN domain nuclease of toxin-antitoxin system
MKDSYLIDTHTFLGWMLKQPGLSKLAISILEDKSNEIVLSAVTCWEMVIKDRLGKLKLPLELATDVEAVALAAGFRLLPISFTHAQRTGLLARIENHKDPFDRL